MKIVFLDAATVGSDISLDEIASLGELTCWQSTSPEQVAERIADCEVVIINKIKFGKEQIDAAPRLKLICEAATGVNNIDVEYAAARGIPVKNVAAYSTESVVQATFMHILSLVGQIGYFDASVKSGAYSASGCFTDVTRSFFELSGKKMGIVGMGTIGHRVAEVATAFGMQVSYFSTSGTGHCKDYPSVPLEELLRESDIVSVHAPLNSLTDNLIAAPQLALMKPSAYIVNMGRGGIVNEADLAAALDGGVIAGAALDVFATEPLPAGHPFIQMDHKERVSLTPHVAWASVEARRRLVAGIAKNIRENI